MNGDGINEPTENAEPEAKPVTKPTGQRKTRRRSGSTTRDRKFIEQVAARTLELRSLADDDRTLIAAVVDCNDPDDLAKLTGAVLTVPKSRSSMIDDLLSLAESDAMEAGMVAAGMTRGEVRAAIGMFNALIGEQIVPVTTSDTKNALKLARAIQTMASSAPEHLDRLRGIKELIWLPGAAR